MMKQTLQRKEAKERKMQAQKHKHNYYPVPEQGKILPGNRIARCVDCAKETKLSRIRGFRKKLFRT